MKRKTIAIGGCGLLAAACLEGPVVAGQLGGGRASGFEMSYGYGFVGSFVFGYGFGGYGYGPGTQSVGRSSVAGPTAGGGSGAGSGGGSGSGGNSGASAKPANLSATSNANRAGVCAGPIAFSWSGTTHEGFGGSYADVCAPSETAGRRF